MAAGLTRGSAPRVAAVLGLVLAVSTVHWAVGNFLAARAGEFDLSRPMPPRLQVAYVREMEVSEPPRARPAQPARKPRRRATAAATAQASAPASTPSEPVQAAAAASPASAAEPVPPAAPPQAAGPEVLAAAVPASDAGGVAEPTFEWPGSTRLRYVLTGYVRGEVHGQAEVEWIRAGDRYQVHLDVQVGPSFAPLARRRMSSDGEITPQGLAPRRYDQETRVAFDGPYRATVQFEPDRIVFANGRASARWPGVQDTASQFVQLSYWFDSQPQRLRAGEVVEIPLAMPRNVSTWVYDVLGEETLYTPFGELAAYHLKPRREAQAGGDLVTEIWIAPRLRHLPVRFRIHQDAENYVDLMLDRRPELAAPVAPASSPPRTPP
jgi:hypothetical protein